LSGSTSSSRQYDGYYCRADTWATSDGQNWTLLNGNSSFGGRAWYKIQDHLSASLPPSYTASMLLMSSHPSFIPRQGLVVNPGASPKQDWLDHSSPPKMFMFGGGYIGFQVGSNKKVRSNPLVLILSLQQNAFDFTVHQSVWLHGWILLPGRG
jgi:hypothetical protein